MQIDAFADRVLAGNPAAVMPLPHWFPDDTLQAVAAENNLSETAFYLPGPPPGEPVPEGSDAAYRLRWFTPAVEVDLCGHATLATAGHLFDDVHPDGSRISFATRSGWLHVCRGERAGELVMDFPASMPQPVAEDDAAAAVTRSALGISPVATYRATDLLHLLPDVDAVRAVTADLSRLSTLPVRAVMVTAPVRPDEQTGDLAGVDFVSRFFAAAAGAFEDPVTGSAHTQLAPFWAARLGRTRLTGRQVSARGGTVGCELDGDRVRLTGSYRRYLDGRVTLPEDVVAPGPGR